MSITPTRGGLAVGLSALCLAWASAAGASQGVLQGFVLRPDGAGLASVRVATSSAAWATTDAEGGFSLRVRSGEYRLRLGLGALDARTATVTVTEGRSTEVVIVLPQRGEPWLEQESGVAWRGVPDSSTTAAGETLVQVRADATPPSERTVAMAEMVVIARPDLASAAQQLALRKEMAAVMDSVALDDIKKSPDSTASAATRRIVGASVVGGAYLNVRGLQGRYTNVRLNGVTLPSTDPDLPGFQIDLFPVSLLTSLNVTKTMTPDIPGDFTGGSLNVVTRDYPESFQLGVSLGLSGDAGSLGGERLTYDGGALDFLGLDDGTRALPEVVPAARVSGGRLGLAREEIVRIARGFPNTWAVERGPPIPDLSLSVNLGDTLERGADRLGYFFTLGYRWSNSALAQSVTNIKLEGMGEERRVAARETLSQELGAEEAQLAGLATAAYAFGEDDELRLVSFWTQSADDRASRTTGLAENEGREIEQTQLKFVARRLFFNQLLGAHRRVLGSFDLEWQLNASLTARDQPDTRDLLYAQGPDGPVYRNVTGSGDRLYTELGQLDLGGGFHLSRELWAELKASAGYLGRYSSRDFSARRFGQRYVGDAEARLLPPQRLFAPESYGVLVELNELTRADDGFAAEQLLNAGYLMADARLPLDLRLVGGARLEVFHQAIEARSPFATDAMPAAMASTTDADLLPAASLVWSAAADMNLRASYGGTLARPLVRELSPFLNQDFVRRRTVQGNPALERTFIHNLDLRWEVFPGETEVLAASAFVKLFQSPIEGVILDDQGNLTFENIAGAQNYGVELEARLELVRLARWLAGFNLMSNLALVHSRVSLTEEQAGLATSPARPLAGQSPFVANLSLGYEDEEAGISANVFYNVFGPRISDVGRLGLPDVFEEPFHSLDATVFWKFSEEWTVSLFGRNLLVQPVRFTQGGFSFLEYQRGVTVGTRLAWAL